MTVSNIALARALGGIGNVTVVACNQAPNRVAGTISYSPSTPGVFTVASQPFVLTDWLKVEVASVNLPPELANAEALFIRPVPGRTDKVYLYGAYTFKSGPSPAAVGLLPTAGFTGQILDSAITDQRSVAAIMAAYTAQYPNSPASATSFGTFGTGGYDSAIPPSQSLEALIPKSMATNTSGSTRQITHMLIYAAPFNSGDNSEDDGLIAVSPVIGQTDVPNGVAPVYQIKATITKL